MALAVYLVIMIPSLCISDPMVKRQVPPGYLLALGGNVVGQLRWRRLNAVVLGQQHPSVEFSISGGPRGSEVRELFYWWF